MHNTGYLLLTLLFIVIVIINVKLTWTLESLAILDIGLSLRIHSRGLIALTVSWSIHLVCGWLDCVASWSDQVTGRERM